MAHKVVGTGTTVAILSGAGSTSAPISLQTGYLRIATSVAAHVGVASTSTVIAAKEDYFLPSADSVVIKERIANAVVAAATTGTSTQYKFAENNGNPFVVGDYVTVTGSAVTNYNCTHSLITAINDKPGYESITVSNNTSSAAAFTGTANVKRSVVVTTLGTASGYAQISQLQITSEA